MWGVELARQSGLTLIGRARGKRFTVLSGPERIVFDEENLPAPKAAKSTSKSREVETG